MPQTQVIPGGPPIFTREGEDLYPAAQRYFAPYAKPGPYQTTLTSEEEGRFRAWVAQMGVPFDPNMRIGDYDMRGFWKAMVAGQVKSWQKGNHFPDTWKTPADTSFSAESMYAKPNAPLAWQGNRLVNTKTNQIVFEAQPRPQLTPWNYATPLPDQGSTR